MARALAEKVGRCALRGRHRIDVHTLDLHT
jgi:hypothetical protein